MKLEELSEWCDEGRLMAVWRTVSIWILEVLSPLCTDDFYPRQLIPVEQYL